MFPESDPQRDAIKRGVLTGMPVTRRTAENSDILHLKQRRHGGNCIVTRRSAASRDPLEAKREAKTVKFSPPGVGGVLQDGS